MNQKLLKIIEKNNKISTEDLAMLLNISEVEVIKEIAKLEEEKVICGYNTIINWDKVSDEVVSALIEVKVIPQRETGFDKIAERIYQFEEVDSLYLMSGTYDFVVMLKGKSMKEISKFVFEKLATLDLIQSTATHFVMKKYKDHGVSFIEKDKTKRNNVIL